MDTIKIIEVKEDVRANNDRAAEALRARLHDAGTLLINLMSSPGSGKTTLLAATLDRLADSLAIGVMEADVDSDVDAHAVAAHGARAIQLHTGGMCHLDAAMTEQGLHSLGIDGLDLVFLENVGNLICPAEFDTGAGKKVMILSVPEGHDKPLKYPLMFEVSDLVIVSKMDVAPYFDFDLKELEKNVRMRNPNATICPLSAKTGEGMDAWCNWLRAAVNDWKK
ncbi:MAG: hydrogenase nickel incorporation protein HypB [Atopobiaceae bacterium]|nr:hydrogenase nickel incorporation protein HypB [Atopobiaceae bacterium]MDO4404431.1 hydrogenase nickel incorporation protein HypB [Atopobiaceae bacterium]